MVENTSSVSTLHDLLDYDARKFTNAEVQLKAVLPEWGGRADSIKLKTILQKYLELVEEHIEKMDGFFETEKITSLSSANRVMRSFIDEVNEKTMACTDAEVKDACLLACVQSINHFKISAYGTAAAFAKTLNMEKEAAIFHSMEVNEKQIDDRLTQLAEFEINSKAKAPIFLHS